MFDPGVVKWWKWCKGTLKKGESNNSWISKMCMA